MAEPGGLRLGESGLTVGGFATATGERLETGEWRGELEGINFLLFFDRLKYVTIFSEIEVGDVLRFDSDAEEARSDPAVDVDRLYADVRADDTWGLRFGKFLTPIGRWNVAPAEPFVWTTSEPLVVEEVFDEAVTGAMVEGTWLAGGDLLTGSVYATFLDPIAPDPEDPPADHAVGARLEWEGLGGGGLGASWFASEPVHGRWNHLGGVDALWLPASGVELSGELAFGEGTRANGALFGLFAQAVVETVPSLYAIVRYERFEPPDSGRGIDLVDLGIAWVPAPALRVKADYRIADHPGELASPGLFTSVAVLF